MQRVVVAACLCALLLAGLSVGAQKGTALHAAPAFEDVACEDVTFIPDGFDRARLRCGTVTVHENHNDSGSREIKIMAAVIKAASEQRKADPVVFLPGGPGQSSVDFITEISTWYSEALHDRDFIAIDARGTGQSAPLKCEEIDRLVVDELREGLDEAEAEARFELARATCLQRYATAGADLSQYHSAAIARDMVQVMSALGYEEWNIIGGSYGTRLALTAMRDAPNRIRSVVLDAPAPPVVNIDIERARIFERKLKKLWAACNAHPRCGAAYPNIEQTLWDLVARANENPIPVQITTPEGAPIDIEVSGDDILNGVFVAMFDTTLLPLIPFAIDDIARGNTGVLATVASAQLFVDYGIATGMFYSVQCNEEWPFYTPSVLQEALAGVRKEVIDAGVGGTTSIDSVYSLRDFCETWNAPVADPREDDAITSSVPALILAGEFDTNTPVEFGETAAATLPNAFVVTVPSSGHFVTHPHRGCTNGFIADFVANPGELPDDTCIRAIPPIDFVVADPAAAPDPQPTPGRAGGTISAPDTGTGPAKHTSNPMAWAFASAGVGAVLLWCGKATARSKGRRRD